MLCEILKRSCLWAHNWFVHQRTFVVTSHPVWLYLQIYSQLLQPIMQLLFIMDAPLGGGARAPGCGAHGGDGWQQEACGFSPATLTWHHMASKWSLAYRDGVSIGTEGQRAGARGTECRRNPWVESGRHWLLWKRDIQKEAVVETPQISPIVSSVLEPNPMQIYSEGSPIVIIEAYSQISVARIVAFDLSSPCDGSTSWKEWFESPRGNSRQLHLFAFCWASSPFPTGQ